MKILTWNCNGAFRKKYHLLEHLDADIIVIQECEDPSTSSLDYKTWASNYLWTGERKYKGLGLFWKDGYDVKLNDWEDGTLKHFISANVNDDFNVLATWCHGANSPTFGYIGQLWKYLQVHKHQMNNMIIAGDLNSNKRWDVWDRWWNHSDVIRELEEIGIKSLYHEFYQENQGEETQDTFFLQRNVLKKYHIDYIFADKTRFRKIHSITVLNDAIWSTVSDHLPVVAEI